MRKYTDAERWTAFWQRVDLSGQCWVWRGARRDGGYGSARAHGATHLAHRLTYEAFFGPVPPGLDLDHLCRNPPCVRPTHLEPVSRRTNTLRGVGPTARHAAATECVNGHSLDDANTLRCVRNGHVQRCCRLCNRAAVRRYKKRKAADGRLQ